MMKGLVVRVILWFGLVALGCGGWDNLDYGVPSTNGLVLIDREGYALGFDTNRQQSAWVSYRLTAAEASPTGSVARAWRSNDFREDPLLPADTVSLNDYRGIGLDRGHLAPAADMKWSAKAMSESFYLSNMSPQRPRFNRGIWRRLEGWVRELARTNGSVCVVSGPVFGTSTNRIGRHGVLVPDGYYKVLLVETVGNGTNVPVRTLGFLLPNAESTNRLEAFRVPVSAVEKATGLGFFSVLPTSVQTNLEARRD